MAKFDLNAFFASRQAIANEMGSREAQRRVAEIRLAVANAALEAEHKVLGNAVEEHSEGVEV